MKQSFSRFLSGSKLVSRFPQGMHKMSFVSATVREVETDSYVIDLGTGYSVRYGHSELHREFRLRDDKELVGNRPTGLVADKRS